MSIEVPRNAPGGDGEREHLTLARVLMKRAPFGVALLDADLRYILVNETLAGLHGLAAEQHKGRSVIDVIPRVAKEAVERMQRVLATGEELMNQEEVSGSLRPEGRRRFWTVSYRRVELSSGAPGLCVVIQEITDRKEIEARGRARLYEAERRANERLRILAEASELFASSLDYETTLASIARVAVPRFADACTLEMLTADNELALVGLSHADPSKEAALREVRLRFPPRPDNSLLFRALASGKPAVVPSLLDANLVAAAESDEHLRCLRDVCCRSYIVVPLLARGHVIGVMVLGRDRGPFDELDDLALAEDLARRAALAIDSAKLYREAQEASRSKDEFLSVLSHELRTPLNAILGWAAILMRKRDDSAGLARGIEVIERNARAQVKIIEDILDVSRIITGKLRLDRRLLEVEAVVRASIEVLRPAADAKQVEIASVLEARLPKILGDPDRLQQVVWNLLSNAVKFTPKGGRVEIRLEQAGASAVLRVSDSGPGISPEFLPYVFDRFRQADSSSSRAHGGLGLGLSIVRYLVEMHGGSVAAESPGALRGATFTVTLPIPDDVDVEDQQFGGRISLVEIDTSSIAVNVMGLRVLLVDDEVDSRDIMVSVLREGGAEVRAVSSAREALDELMHFQPDVLVSDIGMPDEDGHALLRKVRSLPPPLGRIPAVALTAYARPEDARKAFLAGFQMHVSKPVEPAVLATVVANLGGRVAHEES